MTTESVKEFLQYKPQLEKTQNMFDAIKFFTQKNSPSVKEISENSEMNENLQNQSEKSSVNNSAQLVSFETPDIKNVKKLEKNDEKIVSATIKKIDENQYVIKNELTVPIKKTEENVEVKNEEKMISPTIKKNEENAEVKNEEKMISPTIKKTEENEVKNEEKLISPTIKKTEEIPEEKMVSPTIKKLEENSEIKNVEKMVSPTIKKIEENYEVKNEKNNEEIMVSPLIKKKEESFEKTEIKNEKIVEIQQNSENLKKNQAEPVMVKPEIKKNEEENSKKIDEKLEIEMKKNRELNQTINNYIKPTMTLDSKISHETVDVPSQTNNVQKVEIEKTGNLIRNVEKEMNSTYRMNKNENNYEQVISYQAKVKPMEQQTNKEINYEQVSYSNIQKNRFKKKKNLVEAEVKPTQNEFFWMNKNENHTLLNKPELYKSKAKGNYSMRKRFKKDYIAKTYLHPNHELGHHNSFVYQPHILERHHSDVLDGGHIEDDSYLNHIDHHVETQPLIEDHHVETEPFIENHLEEEHQHFQPIELTHHGHLFHGNTSHHILQQIRKGQSEKLERVKIAFDLIKEMGKHLSSRESLTSFAYKLYHLHTALKMHNSELWSNIVDNYKILSVLLSDTLQLKTELLQLDIDDQHLEKMNTQLNDIDRHKKQLEKTNQIIALINHTNIFSNDTSPDTLSNFIVKYCNLNSQAYRIASTLQMRPTDSPFKEYMGIEKDQMIGMRHLDHLFQDETNHELTTLNYLEELEKIESDYAENKRTEKKIYKNMANEIKSLINDIEGENENLEKKYNRQDETLENKEVEEKQKMDEEDEYVSKISEGEKIEKLEENDKRPENKTLDLIKKLQVEQMGENEKNNDNYPVETEDVGEDEDIEPKEEEDIHEKSEMDLKNGIIKILFVIKDKGNNEKKEKVVEDVHKNVTSVKTVEEKIEKKEEKIEKKEEKIEKKEKKVEEKIVGKKSGKVPSVEEKNENESQVEEDKSGENEKADEKLKEETSAEEKPTEEKPAEKNEEEKPSVEEEKSNEEEKRVEEKSEENPSQEEKPAAEEEKPAAEEEKPAAEEEKPAAEEEKPAVEEEKPAAEEEKPVSEEEKPAAEKEKPAAEEKLAEENANKNQEEEKKKKDESKPGKKNKQIKKMKRNLLNKKKLKN